MNTVFGGNCIRITIEPNELTSKRVPITLPEGYSYESIKITYLNNISELVPYFLIIANTSYHIPPVRSHSPSTFNLLVGDLSKRAEIRILIEKFGQIPDAHYFDNPFTPILVHGDDGNEYNVIPSTPFK
jgi:hypothetical protein|nr:MAG TPA: hypothetical protein [Caudoviricetes sp.]